MLGGPDSFLSVWAQKGPIQVYIAKYNYDPFEFSPNENPEAELPLTAGDYVLVVGEMDEVSSGGGWTGQCEHCDE